MKKASNFLKRMLLTGALVISAAIPARAQSYTCSSSSEDAIALHRYIVKLVAATSAAWDTAYVNTRNLYTLPAGPASTVTLQTKRTICQAAGAAYHQVLHPNDPPVSRNLVVVKVSTTRYVVLDTNEQAGEFEVHLIFDAAWQYIKAFAS